MGGMVALEMAKLLKRMGHEIPLVLMLESYSYRQCGVTPTMALFRFHKAQEIVFNASNIIRSLNMIHAEWDLSVASKAKRQIT